MLQVARLAPSLLHDSTDLIAQYIQSTQSDDGGFGDRSGNSDLYYTVFGLGCLRALQLDVSAERVRPFLEQYGCGESLDFVHLSCLARCWAEIGSIADGAIIDRLATHRTADGGFSQTMGEETGSVYAAFLALGAYQDLNCELPDAQHLAKAIESLRTDDGGYANDANLPMGSVPATAAAVSLLHHLEQPIDRSIGDWLLERCGEDGGFFAHPLAPIPDLLSTATALHALVTMHMDIEPIKEACLDFLDTLWSSKGGFCGSWTDETVDCEYTWYALLALGHLSL